MAEEKRKGWYKHPSSSDHPDNKPPVTIIGESSEEDVKAYEDKINAELEKMQPEDTGEPKAEAKSEPVDYESKTVPELKEMAAEKGIAIPWDANKHDIIKALKKGK